MLTEIKEDLLVGPTGSTARKEVTSIEQPNQLGRSLATPVVHRTTRLATDPMAWLWRARTCI